MSALLAPDAIRPGEQGSPRAGMTIVELTWVEQSTERWIRFGQPVLDTVIDRRRRQLSFVADSVFAFVRWASNDYGTILSRLSIIRAVVPGQAYSTHPCIAPGGELLLQLRGWPRVRLGLALIDTIEERGFDPCAIAHDYWSHAHNRLVAGFAPRPYSPARHRAWLLRRAIGA